MPGLMIGQDEAIPHVQIALDKSLTVLNCLEFPERNISAAHLTLPAYASCA